jgi:predicted DCC family thiol-disulfide oxidoreductase YuxK
MKSVIIFDGVCNLCNASVDFILRHDTQAHFLFATQPSDVAQAWLEETNIPSETFDAVILWENGKVFIASTAALRIARRLQFPWPLFYGFMIVPRPIRDFVYAWIARNRYRWFGKRDTCRLPTPEERDRFLD